MLQCEAYHHVLFTLQLFSDCKAYCSSFLCCIASIPDSWCRRSYHWWCSRCRAKKTDANRTNISRDRLRQTHWWTADQVQRQICSIVKGEAIRLEKVCITNQLPAWSKALTFSILLWNFSCSLSCIVVATRSVLIFRFVFQYQLVPLFSLIYYVNRSQVLIFSQMVRVLDLLQELLQLNHYRYERLDGTTSASARNAAVDRFKRETFKRFVMLLSTRAGGLGLNLTAAE